MAASDPHTSLRKPESHLEYALDYAANGFPVLPVRPLSKVPLTRCGVKDATVNTDAIRRWWTLRPNANIGLAIPPGLVVLDLDSPEALQRLRAEGLALPSTVDATTGRGRHLWYSVGNTTIQNRVALFPDVDIRAAGGYVVVPPSIHPSGAVYRWKVQLQRSAIADCPEWLIERLVTNPAHQGRSTDEWYRKITAKVPKGRRNQALAEISGYFFRYLPAHIAAEAAYCWAKVKLAPPLPEHEAKRTIDSIAGRELRQRGGAV